MRNSVSQIASLVSKSVCCASQPASVVGLEMHRTSEKAARIWVRSAKEDCHPPSRASQTSSPSPYPSSPECGGRGDGERIAFATVLTLDAPRRLSQRVVEDLPQARHERRGRGPPPDRAGLS